MPTKTKKAAKEGPELQREYDSLKPLAERFLGALIQEISFILSQNSLALAVPIQGRIKSWTSIAEKCDRQKLSLESITDLSDLIGLRLIFLFSRDLKSAIGHISSTFYLIEQEDTLDRLSESQFGYQSHHLVVSIPDEWTTVPTLLDCEKFQIEIQMRTVAQHAWAAASHQLQYKREGSVPLEVRRSINRVSALLETVDLEFERLLSERETYVAGMDSSAARSEPLNVDILTAILDDTLPPQNRKDDDSYDGLIQDLESAKIVDTSALYKLIRDHLKETIKHDQEIVEGKHEDYNVGKEKDRVEKGVFLSHAGLVRHMLRHIGKL